MRDNSILRTGALEKYQIMHSNEEVTDFINHTWINHSLYTCPISGVKEEVNSSRDMGFPDARYLLQQE